MFSAELSEGQGQVNTAEYSPNQGVVNYAQQQNIVPVYRNEFLIENRIIPTKSICIVD